MKPLEALPARTNSTHMEALWLAFVHLMSQIVLIRFKCEHAISVRCNRTEESNVAKHWEVRASADTTLNSNLRFWQHQTPQFSKAWGRGVQEGETTGLHSKVFRTLHFGEESSGSSQASLPHGRGSNRDVITTHNPNAKWSTQIRRQELPLRRTRDVTLDTTGLWREELSPRKPHSKLNDRSPGCVHVCMHVCTCLWVSMVFESLSLLVSEEQTHQLAVLSEALVALAVYKGEQTCGVVL